MKGITQINSGNLNDAEYLGLLQAFVKIGENAAKGPVSSYFEAFRAIVESLAKFLANKNCKPKHLHQILNDLRIKLYSELCDLCKQAEKSGALIKVVTAGACTNIMAKCVSAHKLSEEKVTEIINALTSEIRSTWGPELENLRDAAETLGSIEFNYQIAKTLCEHNSEQNRLNKFNAYRRECIYMYDFLMGHAETYASISQDKGSEEFIKLLNAEIKCHKGLAAKQEGDHIVNLADMV